MTPILVAYLVCLVATSTLTRVMISRSQRAGLIDTPNERSSHTVPTPRGGGVAFVSVFLVAAIVLSMRTGAGVESFLWWLLPSGLTIATLGFLDDRFSLRASRRLLVQAFATVGSLAVLFYQLPSPSIFFAESFVSLAGGAILVFSFFWILWMTNLYNFMDGIDGYAASQAFILGLALSTIAWMHGLQTLNILFYLLSASVAGFLGLNWAPAKIFMGDAGSTFLGFFFGVAGVSLHLQGIPLETTIILLGTFIVDSTYTLIVRLARGKKVHLAHRDHAYQHAVQMGWSHRKTVLVYCGITIFWLIPLAIHTSRTTWWVERSGLVALAFAPLLAMQVYFRAGIERK